MNEVINDNTTLRRLGVVILTLCGITAALLVIVSVVSHAV